MYDGTVLVLTTLCPFRRVKLKGLGLLTDAIITPSRFSILLEMDLNHCELITEGSARLVWTHLVHMREICLSHCPSLTNAAFPAPVKLDVQPAAILPEFHNDNE